jgi:hypothetical protein
MNLKDKEHRENNARKLAAYLLCGDGSNVDFHEKMEKYGRLVYAHKWTIGVALGICFSRTYSVKLIHHIANKIERMHMSPDTACKFIKEQTDVWLADERGQKEVANDVHRAEVRLALQKFLKNKV